MSETLYKLTPDGYNRLWTYARNHPDKYMDPGIKFDDILSEGSTDEPYRIDSGVKITRSLELPPADAKNRHRGDMYCLGFYRSMDGMTPRIASDPMVLAYINHFYLHPYAISRWEHKQNPRETVRSISNHWFSSSRLYLTKWNTAGRLWWMAHMAVQISKISNGRLTEDQIIEKFVSGAEYYHRSLEYEVLMNPVLLMECVRALIDNPDINTSQYMNLIRAINRECGARLLDALSCDNLENLVNRAVTGLEPKDKADSG